MEKITLDKVKEMIVAGIFSPEILTAHGYERDKLIIDAKFNLVKEVFNHKICILKESVETAFILLESYYVESTSKEKVKQIYHNRKPKSSDNKFASIVLADY